MANIEIGFNSNIEEVIAKLKELDKAITEIASINLIDSSKLTEEFSRINSLIEGLRKNISGIDFAEVGIDPTQINESLSQLTDSLADYHLEIGGELAPNFADNLKQGLAGIRDIRVELEEAANIGLSDNLEEMEGSAESTKKSLEELNNSQSNTGNSGANAQHKYKETVDETNDSIKESNNSLADTNVSINDLWGMLAKIIAARAFRDMARDALELNANLEMTIKQFEVLTGDLARSQELVKEMADFSDNTSMTTEQMLNATKKLEIYGINTKQQMKNIADAASVIDPSKLEEMAEWMGKLNTGASTGRAITRLAELGVLTREMLTMEGIEFGSNNELLSSIDDTMRAANKIIEERYGEGVEITRKTWQGTISTLTDYSDRLLRDTTGPLFDQLNQDLGEILDDFIDKLNNGELDATLENVSDSILEIYEGFKLLIVAGKEVYGTLEPLLPLVGPLVQLIVALKGLKIAGSAAGGLAALGTTLAATNPIVLLAGAGILTLSTAMLELKKSSLESKLAYEEFSRTARREVENITAVNSLIEDMEELHSVTDKTGEQYTELGNVYTELEQKLGLQRGELSSLGENYEVINEIVRDHLELKQRELELYSGEHIKKFRQELMDTGDINELAKSAGIAEQHLSRLDKLFNLLRSNDIRNEDPNQYRDSQGEALSGAVNAKAKEISDALKMSIANLMAIEGADKYAQGLAEEFLTNAILATGELTEQDILDTGKLVETMMKNLGEAGIAEELEGILVQEFLSGTKRVTEVLDTLGVNVDYSEVSITKLEGLLRNSLKSAEDYRDVLADIDNILEKALTENAIAKRLSLKGDQSLELYSNHNANASNILEVVDSYKSLAEVVNRTAAEERAFELAGTSLKQTLADLGLSHLSVADAVGMHAEELERVIGLQVEDSYAGFMASIDEISSRVTTLTREIENAKKFLGTKGDAVDQRILQGISEREQSIALLENKKSELLLNAVKEAEKAAERAARRREEEERARIQKARDEMQDRLAANQGRYDRSDQSLENFRAYIDEHKRLSKELASIEEESITDRERRLTEAYNLEKRYHEMRIQLQREQVSNQRSMVTGAFDRSDQSLADFQKYRTGIIGALREQSRLEDETIAEKEARLTELKNLDRQYTQKWLEEAQYRLDRQVSHKDRTIGVVEMEIAEMEKILRTYQSFQIADSRTIDNLRDSIFGLRRELEGLYNDLGQENYRVWRDSISYAKEYSDWVYQTSRQTIADLRVHNEEKAKLEGYLLENSSMNESEKMKLHNDRYRREREIDIRRIREMEHNSKREFELSEKNTEAYEARVQAAQELYEMYKASAYTTEEEIRSAREAYEDLQRELKKLSEPTGNVLADITQHFQGLLNVFSTPLEGQLKSISENRSSLETHNTVTIDLNVSSTGDAVSEEGVQTIAKEVGQVLDIEKDLIAYTTYSGGATRVK